MLSDGDIEVLMVTGKLKIEGFNDENLTPNGYDLTISDILIPSLNASFSNGTVQIPPLTWFLVGTKEVVELPEELAGDLWIKTSWARKGVISSFGKIDAGFRGNLTLSALNASNKELGISIGDKFAQIVFIPLKRSAVKSYAERSGNYQGQKGVTIDPKKIM